MCKKKWSSKHIYAGDQLIATIENDGETTKTYYLHTDHLGGSSVISDVNGAVVQVLDYYPFGDIRTNEKYGGFDEQRKFTGHEYDDSTELNYMIARYQNPAIGKFISVDPVYLNIGNKDAIQQITGRSLEKYLSDPQGLNSYSYARNNPVNAIDPTGEYFLFGKTRAKMDIKKNRSNIINAANQFPDVRADILAANIFEERRGFWNVNAIDNLDVPAGLFGSDMSIGLGQIRISTAQNVANAGYFDIDKLYSDNFKIGFKLPQRLKLIRLLNNSKTNTTIGAAFMQQQIDKWKETNSDVADNSKLLGSLYNYSEGTPTAEGYSNNFGQRVENSLGMVQKIIND